MVMLRCLAEENGSAQAAALLPNDRALPQRDTCALRPTKLGQLFELMLGIMIALPGADETKALLPFMQLAEARAEIALDATVVERVPVFRRRHAGHFRLDDSPLT